MKEFKPAERLIVAADYKPKAPEGREWVRGQVLKLADSLANTGVYLKVNSALRACGYGLIDEIHARGLRAFADLKLYDIGETLATDGVFLRETKPELLTVVCATGDASMKALKAELPDTEVLGVTVLTSVTENEASAIFHSSGLVANVTMFALKAQYNGLDGIICSPTEAERVRVAVGPEMTINTPGIRPTWSIISGDDQNTKRVTTPAEAIRLGADRIVVGRPITQHENPLYAVIRTMDEISDMMETLAP